MPDGFVGFQQIYSWLVREQQSTDILFHPRNWTVPPDVPDLSASFSPRSNSSDIYIYI
jgi:hypothetical protein